MTKSAYQELLACAIRNPSTEPRLCRLLPREFGVPVPWERNSMRRVCGVSAIRARTSASQACGSTSLSFCGLDERVLPPGWTAKSVHPPEIPLNASSEVSPLVHRLAPVKEARERRKQIGELGVPTILPDEPLHVAPLAPSARFADNGEARPADIGQEGCAIAGHDGLSSQAVGGEYGRTKRELKALFTRLSSSEPLRPPRLAIGH